MKNINLYYDGIEPIEKLIEQQDLDRDFPYFVQIIISNVQKEKSVEIAKYIQSTFANASIMGFSSGGLVYNGTQIADGALILFKEYEKSSVFCSTFSWDQKSAKQVAFEVANAIEEKNARFMHVICSDYYYDVHDFVEEFNKINQITAMVGGLAGGTDPINSPGFVFNADGIVDNGIIIGAICGDEFSFYTGINTSHEPISVTHKLTKVENGIWKEINGQNISEWLFEQLGIEKPKNHSEEEILKANAMLVHFPFILENSHYASRFLRYAEDGESVIQYYHRVPQDTEFKIGYVDPNMCLNESFRLCNEVMNHPIEEIFCYSCLFRKIYLENSSDWELKPYKKANICGAFLMGEISNVDGKNEVLNGSCCIVGIAENETYIRPSIHVFDELTAIGADTTNLLNIVLKRQQATTTRKNQKLIKTLLQQQEEQEKQMFVDFNTGVDNYLKYKEDCKDTNFDKLCVIKMENAELLSTHLGHTSYLKIIRNVVNAAKGIVDGLVKQKNACIKLYIFNESTFFIAADERLSEDEFMNICNNMHNSKQLFHASDGEIVISRFVVCLNQQFPIETALNSLAVNKNTQNSFLVCRDNNDNITSDEEFKIIGVLNRAIESDRIVPYFQGIYNNTEKSITYYEALMRIKDVDGTMYFPIQFIDIAKKYHMYSIISNMMLNKVFDLFCLLDAKVSVNISAYDIQSEETKAMIFDRLAECKKPNNFVFEILEDEAYRDFAHLKEFIAIVRNSGARVAIDDFGSGYSNLHEMSNINFDIVKVDGSIIRNLLGNISNCKLLEVITNIGSLFNAKIVAEFVENLEIQKIVKSYGIEYSQGYYFAKPAPFEELGLSDKSDDKQ